MVKEIWVGCPMYPTLLVSSLGRVKLPDSTIAMPNGGTRTYKTKPTFGYKTRSSKGAKHVYKARNTRKFGNIKIHQCVCTAFHGQKPSIDAVVIHINEDSCDNLAENLRRGSQKENLNCEGFISYCQSRTGLKNPRIKGRFNKQQQRNS